MQVDEKTCAARSQGGPVHFVRVRTCTHPHTGLMRRSSSSNRGNVLVCVCVCVCVCVAFDDAVPRPRSAPPEVVSTRVFQERKPRKKHPLPYRRARARGRHPPRSFL
ncbi:hypothetical protein LX32DRAFT_206352 [Colletotrichum zoysiae]|uniref:Uncharacterized protein n=1 Tax=Colletotrichum zoysiae TaxID=1216348 RepID=A0AAD9H630_9PEZI|nr:hypothetical protein LX32DRAFT_206352 [Colletotrichum zoysiae]